MRILTLPTAPCRPAVQWSDSFTYASPHVLLNPALEEPRDPIAVLLQHHLVRVPWQANIFELHVVRLHSRLVQPLRIARVEDPVIAGLSRHVENPNTRHVDELVCRLLLQ